MVKFGLGLVVGGLLLVFLCVCCCCMSFLMIGNDPGYRKEYCKGYVDGGGDLRNEPFGWCK
jgi:hypothetical protein